MLDSLTTVPVWSMTPDEQRAALVGLARAQARLEGLRLRVLAAADTADIAADSAATSTGAWVAQHTRQNRSAARADVQLARALDQDHPVVRDALVAGFVDPGQARVIVRAVDALPASVPTDQREQAEKHLVHQAGEHDEAALKILGRRVFEVLDPDAAEADEGRKLEAEERAAARATYLHLLDNGDGTHSGRFKIPSLHATLLKTMLNALVSPTRLHACTTVGSTEPDAGSGAVRRVPRPEAMGQAIAELLERVPADRLPTTGGPAVTVVVLLDYDTLLSGVGTAQLTTGDRLSAAQARRLACTSGIIPAVYQSTLGGPSVVLDLGCRSRLHTEPQRIALAIRDRGCTAEGCTRPAAACHAHHDHPWAADGETTLANGRLLCPYHHAIAHSPRYQTEHLPTGQLLFHRGT